MGKAIIYKNLNIDTNKQVLSDDDIIKVCDFLKKNIIWTEEIKSKILNINRYFPPKKHIVAFLNDIFRHKICTSVDYWLERGHTLEQSQFNIKIEQKKRVSTINKSYWIKKGYSEEDAKLKVSKEQSRRSSKQYERKTKEEIQLRSPRHKSYWIKKGYSEEDAKLKVSEIQRECSIRGIGKRSIENTNTKIEFYLTRGYSEEDAKLVLSKRQSTFSKERCIEEYGVEGERVWQERQDKWQNTIQSKTKEEIQEINKRKAITLKGCIEKYGEDVGTTKYNDLCTRRNSNFQCSMEWALRKCDNDIMKATELFHHKKSLKYRPKDYRSSKAEKEIYNYIKEQFPEATTQLQLVNNSGKYYYFDVAYNNHIIEFNGDYWHANPLFYNETDILYRGNTAKDIWNKDKEKLDFAISMGYKILVVWEHDYKKNKSELLQNCINHFKGLLINES